MIDEEAFEPPEPDYAHLPARSFQTKPQTRPAPSGSGRSKKLTIKESELAPMKANIDKANAAREFKDRFSLRENKVLTVGDDGIARRQRRQVDDEDVDDDIGDIDSFLAELDMNDGMAVGCN